MTVGGGGCLVMSSGGGFDLRLERHLCLIHMSRRDASPNELDRQQPHCPTLLRMSLVSNSAHGKHSVAQLSATPELHDNVRQRQGDISIVRTSAPVVTYDKYIHQHTEGRTVSELHQPKFHNICTTAALSSLLLPFVFSIVFSPAGGLDVHEEE